VEGVKGEATPYLWYIRSLAQCTIKYLERRIVPIVWADSDIIVDALIEVIHDLTTYRIRYGKAWRANEHALALL
jgi:hypothetical protein